MDTGRKAELKREYKETPQRKGVFCIRCGATDRKWVDSSTSLDSIRNRIRFTLGMGNHSNRDLQQAWNESGDKSMEYEILEVFSDDASDFAVQDMIKERKRYWIRELGAEPLQ